MCYSHNMDEKITKKKKKKKTYFMHWNGVDLALS